MLSLWNHPRHPFEAALWARPAHSLMADMEREMARTWGDLGILRNHSPAMSTSTLSVDIKENDQAYLIQANTPGFQPEEIHVRVEDGVLTVSGSHMYEDSKEETGEECDTRVIYQERRSSSFQRSFALPEDIKSEEIRAEVKDGTLELTLPKDLAVIESRKPRQIEVRSAAPTVDEAAAAPAVTHVPNEVEQH